MNNLCKFSVPRGGVEKTENEKQKNRNAQRWAWLYQIDSVFADPENRIFGKKKLERLKRPLLYSTAIELTIYAVSASGHRSVVGSPVPSQILLASHCKLRAHMFQGEQLPFALY